jgi:hypothetical protein
LQARCEARKETEMATTARWRDWASFALGLWLAVSPWVMGFAWHETATANSALVGLAIALGSHFEVSFDGSVVEWFNFAGGLWLLFAPFLLGFEAQALVAANTIAVGSAVAILAGSALALEKEIGRRWLRREASHQARRASVLR